MELRERLERNCAEVRERTGYKPLIGAVLGSGLGAFADTVKSEAVIPYGELSDFPVSTVHSHAGRFIFGEVSGVPCVFMQGRVHYYEGYPVQDTVLPVRLMCMLGIKALLLTNAAGGVNTSFAAGDLMMITDQISSFFPSPLVGKNDDSLGLRFPDMTNLYDKDLCSALRRASDKSGVKLREGVYLQLTGPNFETPAEIRMMRALGADAVGMSTASEAIAARHMGVRVCGISCISNLAAGMTGRPLSHLEVQETTDRIAESFASLVGAGISEIASEL